MISSFCSDVGKDKPGGSSFGGNGSNRYIAFIVVIVMLIVIFIYCWDFNTSYVKEKVEACKEFSKYNYRCGEERIILLIY